MSQRVTRDGLPTTGDPSVRAVTHPTVGSQAGGRRRRDTDRAALRRLMVEASLFLACVSRDDPATAALDVARLRGRSVGPILADAPGVVPVLRAELGMVPSVLGPASTATVACLGMRRDVRPLRPTVDLEGRASELSGRTVVVWDPTLTTGRALSRGWRLFPSGDAERIAVAGLHESAPGPGRDRRGVAVTSAAIAPVLDRKNVIVARFGDGGDRLFGPVVV